MTAECVIRRATGGTVTNPDFTVTPEYGDVYIGRCKMQTYEGYETSVESAGASVVVQRSTVQIPAGVYSSLPGDIVTIIDSTDPLMVGRSFRVVQRYPVKEHATAYRIFVDEAIGENVPPWEVTP